LSENISAIWYNWKSSDSKQVFPCFFVVMNQMLSLVIVSYFAEKCTKNLRMVI